LMMAKKDMMKINMSVSTCKGTFDKNEDGAYIVVVDDKEYLLDEIADYFLGGMIALDSCVGE
jgi:hypothetical protein